VSDYRSEIITAIDVQHCVVVAMTDGTFNAMYHLDGCTPPSQINDAAAFNDAYTLSDLCDDFEEEHQHPTEIYVVGGRNCEPSLFDAIAEYLHSRYQESVFNRLILRLPADVSIGGAGELHVGPAS
jgi:hypothetical protein